MNFLPVNKEDGTLEYYIIHDNGEKEKDLSIRFKDCEISLNGEKILIDNNSILIFLEKEDGNDDRTIRITERGIVEGLVKYLENNSKR